MQRFKRELKFRVGCPLALIVAALLVTAIEGFGYGRPLRADAGTIWMGAWIGLPFGALALAGARDWLAWLVALGLTIGLWAYILYADRHSTDVMWGFGVIFMPIAIAGSSLALAGMRGRIGWAHDGADAGDKAD